MNEKIFANKYVFVFPFIETSNNNTKNKANKKSIFRLWFNSQTENMNGHRGLPSEQTRNPQVYPLIHTCIVCTRAYFSIHQQEWSCARATEKERYAKNKKKLKKKKITRITHNNQTPLTHINWVPFCLLPDYILLLFISVLCICIYCMYVDEFYCLPNVSNKKLHSSKQSHK